MWPGAEVLVSLQGSCRVEGAADDFVEVTIKGLRGERVVVPSALCRPVSPKVGEGVLVSQEDLREGKLAAFVGRDGSDAIVTFTDGTYTVAPRDTIAKIVPIDCEDCHKPFSLCRCEEDNYDIDRVWLKACDLAHLRGEIPPAPHADCTADCPAPDCPTPPCDDDDDDHFSENNEITTSIVVEETTHQPQRRSLQIVDENMDPAD